jgi:hypothetical protein
MESSSMDATTFKLFKEGSTTQTAAQVSYNADTNTAKLDPTNDPSRGLVHRYS